MIDIYVLDTDYNRIRYVEAYDSLIWTERFNAVGEFEMVLPPSDAWSNIFLNRYLAISTSRAIMVIEEILDKVGPNGERKLTIKGRSMESIIDRRVVTPRNNKENVVYTGTMGEIIYFLVRNICMLGGTVDTRDIIPNFYVFDGTDNTDVVKVAIKYQSLYTAVKDLCDTNNFTFGIDLRDTEPRLRFYIEEGVVRSGVIFSSQLDTLAEESILKSDKDYYNTAYVWSKNGTYQTVAAIGTITREGLDRRVLSVDASDVDVDEDISAEEIIPILRQRGKEALAQKTQKRVFDGALTGLDNFVYRTHYSLGDIVTLQGRDGLTQQVRVSEYIWSIDSNGIKSYPSFEAL